MTAFVSYHQLLRDLRFAGKNWELRPPSFFEAPRSTQILGLKKPMKKDSHPDFEVCVGTGGGIELHFLINRLRSRYYSADLYSQSCRAAMKTEASADRFLRIYLPLAAVFVYFTGYCYLARYLGFYGVTGGYANFPLEAIVVNAYVVFKTVLICSIDAFPFVELSCAPEHGNALSYFWPGVSCIIGLIVLSRVHVKPAGMLPLRATRFLMRNFRFYWLYQSVPVLKDTALFLISVPLLLISLQETAGTIGRADAFDLRTL